MKKIFLLLILAFLASCSSQKVYTDFDISFARSGGFAPIYENLLLKGNNVHYSFEGHGKKIKKDITITAQERKQFDKILTENRFRTIQEDHKKLYDYISTTINVKSGANEQSKSDGSGIMPQDESRWQNIMVFFSDFIESKNLNTP